MDKEYAVCFVGSNGLEELKLSSLTLQGAKSEANYFVSSGMRKATIKYYEEGNLVHQWDWDYQNGNWKQYE